MDKLIQPRSSGTRQNWLCHLWDPEQKENQGLLFKKFNNFKAATAELWSRYGVPAWLHGFIPIEPALVPEAEPRILTPEPTRLCAWRKYDHYDLLSTCCVFDPAMVLVVPYVANLYTWGTIRIFNVAHKIFCVEFLKRDIYGSIYSTYWKVSVSKFEVCNCLLLVPELSLCLGV